MISVKANAKAVTKEIREDRDQIPFALAYALTLTAKDAQHHIQTKTLPTQFTLRRRKFEETGVRIEKATKAHMYAIVKDIHDYMLRQEEGGTKIPYGKHICVPLPGARPTPSSLIKAADRPKAIMDAGGFIRSRGTIAVMYRLAKSSSRKRGTVKGQAQAMYILIPRAKIKPRFGFAAAVRLVLSTGAFERNFDKAFKAAIQSRNAKALAQGVSDSN